MSPLASNPRGGKLILLITLLLFSLTLLVILELSFGYVTFRSDYNKLVTMEERYIRLRENPPNISLREEVTEDAKQRNGIVNLNLNHYVMETDNDGFIQPSQIHDNADLNIFFLGGSTTACRVLEPKQRFPYLAGRMLENLLGLKVNSYNAGVSGNHSFHSLNTLTNKVLKYEPDVVVLMHNSNDVLLIPYGSYWNEAPGKSLITSAADNGSVSDEPFYTFPVLRRWARHSSNKLANSPIPSTYTKYSKQHGDRISVDKDWILNQFENSIRTFVVVCKSWDIQPVLMTQVIFTGGEDYTSKVLPEQFDFIMPESPMKDSAMVSILYTFHGLFNELIRKVSLEEGVMLIDLKMEVPADDHKYIYDYYHYNAEGSEFVASIISNNLAQLFNNRDTNHIDSLILKI